MCGFLAYLGTDLDETDVFNNADKISYRGPDNSSYETIDDNIMFVFHRLSIIDISEASNQPLYLPQDKNISLICNGEIYNYKELISKYKLEIYSNSDCEVILHLYKEFGLRKTLDLLDGVFAFALYDKNTKTLYAARDPYGVRPSFLGLTNDGGVFIASEAKAISDLCHMVTPFPAGCWWQSDAPNVFESYHLNKIYLPFSSQREEEYLLGINYELVSAVKKRMMSDREIGCLLSGGLDSSLIASIVSRLSSKKIKTFSIGLRGSPDLHYAKMVAEWIGSDHHEVEMTTQEFISSIEEVIYKIESYDTTTVRASVGNYLVSKYISENTDCKVIFNGDGSDEACCGYIYNANAPNDLALQDESQRLLDEIYLYDVLRSDRSISSNGLEARTPFLDKSFVEYYMSIPARLKAFNKTDRIEKFLLRKAFESEGLLPKEVLWRRKCAFSDGVSSIKESWHKSIQNYVDCFISDEEFKRESEKIEHCKPLLKESFYYRKVFDELFPGKENLIPRFWMPRWTSVIDPSARELENYKE